MESRNGWAAVCVQTFANSLRGAKTREDARHLIQTKLDHIGRLIEAELATSAAALVLLPEFFLTGTPQGVTTEQWIETACLSLDGPELEPVRGWASRHRIYIGGNAYCTLKEFPGRFFNTAFLISPAGAVELTAHRIHTTTAVSPHDMLYEFLDKVGIDGLFPVARTPLGALAMVTSTDVAWPEVTRAHVLRGAEVILNPTSEPAAVKESREPLRRARAVENMIYLISCNSAGELNPAPAPTGAPAVSRIIDPDGRIIGAAGEGESLACRAMIDVEDVRRRRAGGAGTNYLAQLRTETFAGIYSAASIYPGNTWRADMKNYTGSSGERTKQSLAQMKALGLLPGD